MSLTVSGLVAIAAAPEKTASKGPFRRYIVEIVSQNHTIPDAFDSHKLVVAMKEGDVARFLDECKRANVFLLRFGTLNTGKKGGSYINTFYPRDFQYLEVPQWHPSSKKCKNT